MEFINILQIILAILLTVVILMQNRGAGMSGVFGGGGSNVYMTKRGLEKKLFITTIVLSVAFFAISFIIVIL
ncbi:preprotein translocase subunit SecG [Candidatus Falkowbacteria bacterium]|nr:MAG: preprotein translocase subunit SecG [Candidatus Falkowbacteria bacterium]